MIQVQIRANGRARTVYALPTQNIGEFLTANSVDALRTAIYINREQISNSLLSKTFEEAGYTSNVVISSVVKTANAK